MQKNKRPEKLANYQLNTKEQQAVKGGVGETYDFWAYWHMVFSGAGSAGSTAGTIAGTTVPPKP